MADTTKIAAALKRQFGIDPLIAAVIGLKQPILLVPALPPPQRMHIKCGPKRKATK